MTTKTEDAPTVEPAAVERVEKDSMGEVRIPAGMLYGAQTERAQIVKMREETELAVAPPGLEAGVAAVVFVRHMFLGKAHEGTPAEKNEKTAHC